MDSGKGGITLYNDWRMKLQNFIVKIIIKCEIILTINIKNLKSFTRKFRMKTIFLILIFIISAFCDQDYYQLLGIQKDATT